MLASLGILCYNLHFTPHALTSMQACTHALAHTWSTMVGKGVPWPLTVLVLDIWAADVDLCVCCNSRRKHQGLALAVSCRNFILPPFSVHPHCFWLCLFCLSLSVCLSLTVSLSYMCTSFFLTVLHSLRNIACVYIPENSDYFFISDCLTYFHLP